MFWPLILPFQITLVLMIPLFIIVLLIGSRWKMPTLTRVYAAICLPLALFIPSCAAVSYVVDYYRFGLFHYDSFDAINDFRIERYMPPAATDITVFKHYGGNGYRARFTINPKDFEDWHNDFWVAYGKFSNFQRDNDDGLVASDTNGFQYLFGEFKCSMPSDSVQYHSPIAANGSHYTVHFSPSQQIAFLTGCYW